MTARSDRERLGPAGAVWAVAASVIVASTLIAWAVVGRLAWALWQTDVTIAYVAETSRQGAAWPYRLAALWGGPAGSLSVFAAAVCTAAWVATLRSRPRPPAGVMVAGAATSATVLIGGLLAANPLTRAALPAVRGAGLTPILEHPAMAVHPPVLYAGFGAALAAALAAAAGRSPSRALRWAVSLVAAAMTIGAWWSYAEQGWGGYWAWDPVENSSLVVWLSALVALHVGHRRRWAMVPWIAVLAGSAMVRSGRTPSIHGFADHPAVGWLFVALCLASLAWLAASPMTARHHLGPDMDPDTGPERGPDPAPRPAGAVPLGVVAALVAVGTFAPTVVGWVTGRRVAVRGVFFARVVGPVALVGLVLLVGEVLRRRHRGGGGLLAHLGIIVLLAGVAATTFDRAERIRLAAGRTVPGAGLPVTLDGLDVRPGPRPDARAVVARLQVDGHRVAPSLVAYADLGGVLAETAVRRGPWEDVQVALVTADDAGTATVDVRRRPLTWLLWVGALVTVAGAVPRRRGADASVPPGR